MRRPGSSRPTGSSQREPTIDVAHVARRSRLHGDAAARRQRAVHDRDGDEDAVRWPRLARYALPNLRVAASCQRHRAAFTYRVPPSIAASEMYASGSLISAASSASASPAFSSLSGKVPQATLVGSPLQHLALLLVRHDEALASTLAAQAPEHPCRRGARSFQRRTCARARPGPLAMIRTVGPGAGFPKRISRGRFWPTRR